MTKAKRKVKPQQQPKHPPRGENDLNPERLAGQNIGPQTPRERGLRSAAAIKEVTKCLEHFTMDELEQIPIVAPGRHLEQGAVYLDLRNPAAGPVTATAGMITAEGSLYVAKAETPYEYWNRLIEEIDDRGKRTQADGSEIPEAIVDQTIEDSFPTSDPPAWTTGREPEKPGARDAPREKRAEPEDG